MCLSEYCPKPLSTTCSSAPVCDWSAPAAVRALTLDPRSAAGGGSGFHLRSSQWTQNTASVAGEDCPGPFFLLSCSSPFLYIPPHSSLNLAAPPPGPPCSRRWRSHWEEDAPKPPWCRPWLCLHAVKPAAGGQWQRLGRGFPDAGSGTSTTQHCDVRQRGNRVRYNGTEKWQDGHLQHRRVLNNEQNKRGSWCFWARKRRKYFTKNVFLKECTETERQAEKRKSHLNKQIPFFQFIYVIMRRITW